MEENGLSDVHEADHKDEESDLLYHVEESPPLITTIILAFQNIAMVFGTSLLSSFVVADIGCVGPEHPVVPKIFCSSLFMIGLTTLVQTFIGIRLPILQGVSTAFLIPLVTMKSSGIWTCPSTDDQSNALDNVTSTNSSVLWNSEDILYSRIQELEGSLMVAAFTEVVLGGTGLVGVVLRFIRPISISVALSLMGLSMAPITVQYCNSHWPSAIVTVVVMTVCLTLLSDISFTIPLNQCNTQKKQTSRYPIFQMFSVLVAILVGWFLCFMLTVTNVLPNDESHESFMSRTDSRTHVVSRAPWLSITYPGQFGPPSFNLAVCLGYLAAIANSEMDSIGDYMAVSKVCKRFPPPNHAINRGILIEGLMAFISGSVGIGHATTPYTENVACVKFTKVASRSVMMVSGGILLISSMFGKLGATMSLVPYSVLGGLSLVISGMITALGVSVLQDVDMTSSRNTAIFGVSIYSGYTFSKWIEMYPTGINTGNAVADQVSKIILGTPMFTGAIVSVLLDYTVPDKQSPTKEAPQDRHYSCYEFQCVHVLQKRWKILRHIPFLQPYREVTSESIAEKEKLQSSL